MNQPDNSLASDNSSSDEVFDAIVVMVAKVYFQVDDNDTDKMMGISEPNRSRQLTRGR